MLTVARQTFPGHSRSPQHLLIYQLGFQLMAAGCDACWKAVEMHCTALRFLLRKVRAEIQQPQPQLVSHHGVGAHSKTPKMHPIPSEGGEIPASSGSMFLPCVVSLFVS